MPTPSLIADYNTPIEDRISENLVNCGLHGHEFAVEGDNVRLDHVMRVRRQLVAGTYREDERIDTILDQVLADLDL